MEAELETGVLELWSCDSFEFLELESPNSFSSVDFTCYIYRLEMRTWTGVGGIAQWLNCLSCKCKDLSSDAQSNEMPGKQGYSLLISEDRDP